MTQRINQLVNAQDDFTTDYTLTPSGYALADTFGPPPIKDPRTIERITHYGGPLVVTDNEGKTLVLDSILGAFAVLTKGQ